MFQLNIDTPKSEINQFLAAQDWIDQKAEYVLETEKPGEGNMNVVLRVKTNLRSFILKQSRPYVQKYQQIPAPLDRIDVEYQFYNSLQESEMQAYIPKVLAYDPSQYLMMLSDLGHCEDLTTIYEDRSIDLETLEQLVHFANHVHNSEITNVFPQNLELRKLNHQHIFVLPFMLENGFQLNEVQPGLHDISMTYKTDNSIHSIINRVGNRYLDRGNALLHGDYYPGSWMETAQKLYVIDPEFSFVGFKEFDLGVMAAHITIAEMNANKMDTICNAYAGELDEKLVHRMAGIEIMRRIIGLAQLPIKRTIMEKSDLLKIAHQLILS